MNYRKFIMEIVENIIMSITIEVSIIRKVVNSSLPAYFIYFLRIFTMYAAITSSRSKHRFLKYSLFAFCINRSVSPTSLFSFISLRSDSPASNSSGGGSRSIDEMLENSSESSPK